MSPLHNLDDPSKTCVYLPAPKDDDDAPPDIVSLPNDLPNGYELRLQAYRIAWKKCLDRVQDIVHTLHAPVVAGIAKDILSAYSDEYILPGLPYSEVPVIAVSSAGGTNSVIADVLDALNSHVVPAVQHNGKGKGRMAAHDEEATEEPPCEVVVAHVYPADCPNLISTMKAIISGFIDKSSGSDEGAPFPPSVKRKPTTSLANYDVNLLRAWYSALVQLRDEPPLLTIFLHDFEKLDPTILQHVFYIFSQQIDTLPIVFVLTMSTPSPSAYIHAAFPRSTLALLRLQVHTFPSGRATVEEVIRRTFFDVECHPSITLGSEVLQFLAEFSARHTPLLDATLSILQIAHLKHFEEPFTALVHDSTLTEGQTARGQEHVLHRPESFAFLDELMSQLESHPSQDGNSGPNASTWKATSVENLVQKIDEARELFRLRSQQMRLGFQVFYCVRQALADQDVKFAPPNARADTPLQFMAKFVRGEREVARDLKYLVMSVKMLSNEQMEHVLSQLYALFYDLPPALRRQETSPREFITQTRGNLRGAPESVDKESASSVGEWLRTYIEKRLVQLDESFLWQVWSTGATPFPSELINPAPRMTVVNALLHPTEIVREYEALFSGNGDGDSDKAANADADTQMHGAGAGSRPKSTPAPELWELPDTSILFRRYMDAGKMINVYDWYESFAVELDRQRRENAAQAAAEAEAEESRSRSGGRGRGRGRGRGKGTQREQEREERADPAEMTEEEREKWELETHARFMRALHELDFMGFIKHTGRKADHVVRTVYDIPD